MRLDVKKMIRPILKNFDEHTVNLSRMLEKIGCRLVYEGGDVRQHVLDKTIYACSIKTPNKKTLKSVFPIMLGSKLDMGIRRGGHAEFTCDSLQRNLVNICDANVEFETADIGVTLFLVNGCLRQVPYFFTNDPTNTHVVKNGAVRVYTYDARDRGKELNFYVDTERRGQLKVVLNDGTTSTDVQSFFEHCPYPVSQEEYMLHLYYTGFDIDHLANKVVYSPGHLFVKNIVKYLYLALVDGHWPTIRAQAAQVLKSIQSGCLLHILSRKTLYFKESGSGPKMVASSKNNHREVGMNGEVYADRDTGCYRDVNCQTCPLGPYCAHLLVKQISSKMKEGTGFAHHDSHVGYICILGTFETKNVGRTNMMVRDTYVSTGDAMDMVAQDHVGQDLYRFLKLEPGEDNVHVVINEACVPVTRDCFHRIDLRALKRRFVYIECWKETGFIRIRLKAGLHFKRLEDDLWVTAGDLLYWCREEYGVQSLREMIEVRGYDFITGHHVDLNPFFRHTSFPKDILGFNALKNAVLATTGEYSHYFLETVSAHTCISPLHQRVLDPVDAFSDRFALWMPRVQVAYMSHMGLNQEDAIVVRESLNVFDSRRTYTVRLRIEPASTRVVFHSVRGYASEDTKTFLGTLIGHDPITVVSLTIHVTAELVREGEYNLYFGKPGFEIVGHDWSLDRKFLAISLDQFHESSTGDKFCSLHGQKGVIFKTNRLPTFGAERRLPDLLVNPYSQFRMTLGQILESVASGGKDYREVYNSDGERIVGAEIFLGPVFYFGIAYWSNEHQYIPRKSDFKKEMITNQPLRGRSRCGGLKMGNMEVTNGGRGNGLAAVTEEKMHEHGDFVYFTGGVVVPKSALLCIEDAKYYKCNLQFYVRPCIIEEKDVGRLEKFTL